MNAMNQSYSVSKIITTLLCTILFLTPLNLSAQVHTSTQPHMNMVTSFAVTKNAFFSAGDDGFIIKWDDSGYGEHFQISDIQIKLIAVHPNGNDIAIYETDGFSLHRVSVWDWKNQRRKFAKRFADSIISLNYSERGSYIMTGTASVSGLLFLHAENGSQLNVLKEKTGVITFSRTSKTESSSIMYSPTGYLIYHDIRNGSVKQKIPCEPSLKDTVLFHNNLLFAGIKQNILYVFNSITGKLITSVPAADGSILTSPTDFELLYFSKNKDGIFVLKQITVSSDYSFSESVIKSFYFDEKTKITTAVKNRSSNIFIGTESGDIYKTAASTQETIEQISVMTMPMYDTIYDISSAGEYFFFLTKNGVHRTSFVDYIVSPVLEKDLYKNIEASKDFLILWTKDESMPVYRFVFETDSLETLYHPSKPVQSVSLYKNKILIIENNTTVTTVDLVLKKSKKIYQVTGLQDAIFMNDNEIIAAKTTTTNPRSSLVKVNVDTGETVPINSTGEAAFSLTSNKSDPLVVYGVAVTMNSKNKKSEIFSYSPSTQQHSPLLQWADEDTDAFTYMSNNFIFTNIGKSNVRAVNLNTRRETILERSSSLPKKVTSNTDKTLVLNKDGSLTWFNAVTNKKISDWFLTMDNQWMEF